MSKSMHVLIAAMSVSILVASCRTGSEGRDWISKADRSPASELSGEADGSSWSVSTKRINDDVCLKIVVKTSKPQAHQGADLPLRQACIATSQLASELVVGTHFVRLAGSHSGILVGLLDDGVRQISFRVDREVNVMANDTAFAVVFPLGLNDVSAVVAVDDGSHICDMPEGFEGVAILC